jgi:hypothetical protein
MRVQSILVAVVVSGYAWILSALDRDAALRPGWESRSTVVAAAPVASDASNECLGCHGPFDKLSADTANYVAPNGEKSSPHRYVPHDSKAEEDIPDCTNCHPAHPLDPLPKKGSIDLSKVTIKWCYDACHHKKNFTSCKKCHDEEQKQ